MKTQEYKLNFRRDSIIELNDEKLNEVNGGTSAACVAISLQILIYIHVHHH